MKQHTAIILLVVMIIGWLAFLGYQEAKERKRGQAIVGGPNSVKIPFDVSLETMKARWMQTNDFNASLKKTNSPPK
jgi:hypothetical protein